MRVDPNDATVWPLPTVETSPEVLPGYESEGIKVEEPDGWHLELEDPSLHSGLAPETLNNGPSGLSNV